MKKLISSQHAIEVLQTAMLLKNEIEVHMANHVQYLENGFWTINRSSDLENLLSTVDPSILAEAEAWINEWLAHYGWERTDNHMIIAIR